VITKNGKPVMQEKMPISWTVLLSTFSIPSLSVKLKKVLKQKDPEREILHLETGVKFREFISGDGYSNKLANEVSKRGERQPDFIAVRFWADALVNNVKGDEHIILDGICRSEPEARIFNTMTWFYGRKVTIVYMNVSREWSRERLLARGRADDDAKGIEKRLDWFEQDTYPAVEYFSKNDNFTVIDVNGEQSIEDVHKEIVNKLGW
jgi:adenylate kinase family enzyme